MKGILYLACLSLACGYVADTGSGAFPVCALENPPYRFAEFTCREWSDCDRTCPGYGYGAVACADLIENCPICCSRYEQVEPTAIWLFVILCAITALCIVSLITSGAAGGAHGIITAALFFLACFPRRNGHRRGR